MKLFWKLFLSMMLLFTVLFHAGGFALIYLNFKASLQGEISGAYGENSLVAYSLSIAMAGRREDELSDVAKGLKVGALAYKITDEAGNTIASSAWFGPKERLRLPDRSRGYQLVEAGGKKLIHTVCPATLFDNTLYVESYRDVSRLYRDRQTQLQAASMLLVAMFFLSGLIIFALSLGLTRPISRLSRSVKRFAAGDFSGRSLVKSRDEIGRLSQDFNTMADRLENTIQELSQAAQRQERFVGSFTHELKTPLTSIIGYADLLRSKKLPEEQSALCAKTIFQEGMRLEALSMKLMELMVLKKQEFSLVRITAEDFFGRVARAVYPMLQKYGIGFSSRCERAVLHMEPDLLETLCLNLIDNARKALSAGGKIILRGHKTPEGYRISVMDNGRGMEPEELQHITEAFYMVDKSRSRAQGGAGLGLFICSEIAAIHGTMLNFESTPGKGTTVSLTVKEGPL